MFLRLQPFQSILPHFDLFLVPSIQEMPSICNDSSPLHPANFSHASDPTQHAIGIVNTDATFEKPNFILMMKLQARNFILLYQVIILEFMCQHFHIGCSSTDQKIVAVLFQVQTLTNRV